MTNKGNCFFAENNFEKARNYYEDAIKIDASCVEALYNLGNSYFILFVSCIINYTYKNRINLQKIGSGRSIVRSIF